MIYLYKQVDVYYHCWFFVFSNNLSIAHLLKKTITTKPQETGTIVFVFGDNWRATHK